MINITLPWPPSCNSYYRTVTLPGRGQVTLISAQGRKYKQIVAGLCVPYRKLAFVKGQKLAVKILAFPPDKRKRDIDNCLKAIADSVKGLLFHDDGDIDDLHIVRREVVKNGSVIVFIREVDPVDNPAF